MDPVTALIGASSGLVGQIGGAYLQQTWGRRNAAEAHDWSVEDAAVNRAWQERMSNSAHQREVDDLRKAGLNPILSATRGGAPVGSGATADVDKADTPSVQVGNVAANALELKQMAESINLIKSQKAAQDAQARKTNKEADILGPRAEIYDKVTEMIQWGADSGAKVMKNLKDLATGADKPNSVKLKEWDTQYGTNFGGKR